MREKRPIRILIAKPGLDGHDRGVKVLAMGLRDEGMEVIYLGLRQTPEEIVLTAIQEDVDVIGLSSLSGVHNYYFPKVVELISQDGKEGCLIIGGGIIPDEDIPYLMQRGVKAIFGPGTRLKDIADFIRNNVKCID